MRETLLQWLRCPYDYQSLTLSSSVVEDDAHVMTGMLHCAACLRTYNVRDGVPDFVGTDGATSDGKDLTLLQQRTVEQFGYEWIRFSDWGWLKDFPDTVDSRLKFDSGLEEHSRRDFWGKTLFRAHDLGPGQLILDAGCGNGRFTYQASLTGSEVIGVDLSWSVYSAFTNTRALPRVHIVRADLFRLPFAPETFDRVFTIGVLQHTGNASAAFDSIAGVLRSDGLVAVRVYGIGIVVYEMLDCAIRAMTTRLPLRAQIAFAATWAALSRRLKGGRFLGRLWVPLSRIVTLDITFHQAFDWWTAPVATHHTVEEVSLWFARNGIEVVETLPRSDDMAARRRWRLSHSAISLLGRRREPCSRWTPHALS